MHTLEDWFEDTTNVVNGTLVDSEGQPVVISKAQARDQGLRYYFTGKACKHGHVAKRFVSNGKCAACNRQWVADYKRENPEYVEREQQRLANDPEYRERNRVRAEAWRQANPERKKQSDQAWKEANPHKIAASNAKRRVLERSQVPDDYQDQKPDIQAMYRIRDFLNMQAGFIKYHIDHITPLSKGGLHDVQNLQVAIAAENLSKNNCEDVYITPIAKRQAITVHKDRFRMDLHELNRFALNIDALPTIERHFRQFRQEYSS